MITDRQTGEVNNWLSRYSSTWPGSQWDILGSSEPFVWKVDVLKKEKLEGLRLAWIKLVLGLHASTFPCTCFINSTKSL